MKLRHPRIARSTAAQVSSLGARRKLLVGISLALAVFANAHAQDSQRGDMAQAKEGASPAPMRDMPRPAKTMPGKPAAMQADMAFYRQALTSGTAELDLSRHALQNARSAQVREVAQHMVRDHSALNDKLKSASGMSMPPPPAPADAAKAQAVKAAKGDAYDKAWLDHMAQGHAKSIALYERTSTSAEDAKTRQLAAGALPKLKEHAQHVQSAKTGMAR